MEEPTTQLADTRPLLDTPLRMSIPVNVPNRVLRPSRDVILYTSTFSPMAITQSLRRKEKFGVFQAHETLSEYLVHPPTASSYHSEEPEDQSSPGSSHAPSSPTNKKVNMNGKLVNMDHDALNKNALKDFQVLAFSSKRAGKKDVEATAYASLGVIHDNQEDYITAIEQYKLYLQLCEELGDLIGISAACNCIGVNYMLLALQADQQPGSIPITASPAFTSTLNSSLKSSLNSSVPSTQLVKISDRKREFLQQAIIAHSRHNEVSPDAGGKFVAFVNLGLCLTWLGDINQAARHHQDALRIAIKMQTLYGQSIAVGNLGLLALSKHDFVTARTCFDQHLQLVQALMDPEAEIAAWKLLSDLCTAQEQYEEAVENLEQARLIAEKEGFLNELRSIHSLIGIAKGTVEFQRYTEALMQYHQHHAH